MKKYKNPFGMYGNPYKYQYNEGVDKGDAYGYNYANYSGYDDLDYNNIAGGYNGYSNKYGINLPMQTPREDMDGMDEMDMNYMKKMYPETCRKIQYYIDEECDKMEYDGSYMYDEYPDKEAIDMITDKIYEKVEKDEVIYTKDLEANEEKDEVETQRYRNRYLRDIVKIMLLNEIFGRRRRRYRRRYRRPYYDYYQNYPYYFY